MEIHGAASRRQQHDGGGVKVKFIETQFISSDAASFKSVVQQLTGNSAPALPSPPPLAVPRPNRPRARAATATASPYQAAGHLSVVPGGREHLTPAPVKQQEAARLEDLHELCDFGDLLYAGGARRVDGAGYGFPY
ncbi:uncharacterized protein LOC121054787 [Oryza brachyantha]|uniref:uncharacterized protein LOC121054787 n=1 Tax=Oryza brachyantha TaxID=4533 RepID=UPI001ADC8AB1|nr:uncharacterized protein LOC121054787 [Oryza brachyantha]